MNRRVRGSEPGRWREPAQARAKKSRRRHFRRNTLRGAVPHAAPSREGEGPDVHSRPTPDPGARIKFDNFPSSPLSSPTKIDIQQLALEECSYFQKCTREPVRLASPATKLNYFKSLIWFLYFKSLISFNESQHDTQKIEWAGPRMCH